MRAGVVGRVYAGVLSGGYDATATIYDDGTGMKLIVSDLSRPGSGEEGLQVWDGQSWSTLGAAAGGDR